jgi:hypothetical protein
MDERDAHERPHGRHPVARRIGGSLVLLVLLSFVVSLVATAINNLRDGITAAEWATIGFVAAIVTIAVAAAVLSELEDRYPWARRLTRVGKHVGAGAVTAYEAVVAICVYVVVLLAAFASGFNHWLIDRAPVVQAAVVMILGAIAAAILHRMLNRTRRRKFITELVDRRFGVLYAPAFLTVAASVALAASSAVLLVGADHSWWELRASSNSDPTPRVVETDRLADEALTSKLVLWETLDLVPIVKLPRTLAWEKPPLSYEDWGVGMVLLAFKAVAGVSILATGKALLDAWAGRSERRAPHASVSGMGTEA